MLGWWGAFGFSCALVFDVAFDLSVDRFGDGEDGLVALGGLAGVSEGMFVVVFLSYGGGGRVVGGACGGGGVGGRAWCLGFGVDGMEAMRAVFSEPAGLEHFRLFMTECFCNVPGTRRWGGFCTNDWVFLDVGGGV